MAEEKNIIFAVLIIVLLVAAVGGFYVFSDKHAGEAARNLAAAKYSQPVIGEPIVGQTQTYPVQPYVPPPSQTLPAQQTYPAGTISTTVQQPAQTTAEQAQISKQIANSFSLAFSGRTECEDEPIDGKTEISLCEVRKKTAIFMILMKLNYHDGWKPTLKNLAIKKDKKDGKNKLFILSMADMPTPVPLPAGAVSMCDLSEPLKALNGAIQYKSYSKYTPAEKTKLFDEMYAIQADLKKCTFKDKKGNEIKDDDGVVINLESWLEEKVTDETLKEVYAGLGAALSEQGFDSSGGMKDEVETGITGAKDRALAVR